MQYKVTIEKTDVKHFEFDVDVDMEKVKSWVHENYGTYQTYILDWLDDDEEPHCTEDEFYEDRIEDYLEDLFMESVNKPEPQCDCAE